MTTILTVGWILGLITGILGVITFQRLKKFADDIVEVAKNDLL